MDADRNHVQSVAPAPRAPDRRHFDALWRVGSLVVFAVLPVLTLVTMLAVGLSDNSLSADFHHEIYPQAKLILEGHNPYPPPDFDPTRAPNLIWPPVVVYLLSPLTLLPPGVADVTMLLLGLACMAAALWVVGLRDWRVYGVVAMWPQIAGEMRVSHLTAPLCLLLALSWRWRDRRLAPGVVVGIATAVKFFVWPMAVWLVATRRHAAAFLAAMISGASLLLILPYVSIDDYGRSLLQLGRGFDQDSYTIFGLLVQAGASETTAHVAVWVVGALLLLGTWRYRSFTLAIAAALTISPIVWLDYFALAAVPLAVTFPRLSWVWLLPLGTWGLEGAGIGIGDVGGSVRLLGIFSIVLGAAFFAERGREPAASGPDMRRISNNRRVHVRPRFRRSPTA